MKNCILFILMSFSLHSFSQEKKRSYYFDFYTIQDINDYERDFTGKVIYLSNSNDSTYSLRISNSDKIKQGYLSDKKKEIQ